jgi:pimeloyl-ACP methyl ester carboxylesterase
MHDLMKSVSLCVALAFFAACGGEEPGNELSDDERQDLIEGLFGLPGGGGGGLMSWMGGQGGGGGGTNKDLPADFPQLMDSGGAGAGAAMPNWGGDPTKDQQGNRAALKRTPVILVHGNGASAYGSRYDYIWNLKWDDMVKRLKAVGYNSSEIWAVSYLGSPLMAQLQDPYSSNVDDVRNFIEAVRGYLGVEKVDIIAHSLGVPIVKGYMVGLQRDKTWDHSKHHLDAVGTLVSLSGAHYGMGKQYDMYAFLVGEMLTDFPFEKASHIFQGTVDDTPWGPSFTKQQPVGGTALGGNWKDSDFRGETALDNGKITYVSIWHAQDQCDKLWDNTSRLYGANLNYEVDHINKDAMQAHVGLLHDQKTFDLFVKHLNKVGVVWAKNPPQGGPQTPGWTCKETEASTYGHYVFGRGSLCNGWHVCAKGSGDDLGMLSMLTKVWIAETKSGYFTKGKCP